MIVHLLEKDLAAVVALYAQHLAKLVEVEKVTDVVEAKVVQEAKLNTGTNVEALASQADVELHAQHLAKLVEVKKVTDAVEAEAAQEAKLSIVAKVEAEALASQADVDALLVDATADSLANLEVEHLCALAKLALWIQ